MKSVTYERFAIQNKNTGDLVRGIETASPQTYRTARVAENAMSARGWNMAKAMAHEVVPVTITVGRHAR